MENLVGFGDFVRLEIWLNLIFGRVGLDMWKGGAFGWVETWLGWMFSFFTFGWIGDLVLLCQVSLEIWGCAGLDLA